VLRHVHDVLNLSVALAQHRLGWADYAAIWARASQPQTDALLGEAHLFLARTLPGKTGRVAATAELGQVLDALLPYREDRPQEWWRWGSTTPAGFALWDTGLAADTSAVREIVLVAAADQDQQLSAWAWSDGTPAMPPFARYLMHAAKLRYEARLLDSWHGTAAGQDIDALVAELNAVLEPGEPTPDSAGLLHSLRGRLRADDARLTVLEADLARLAQTVSLAQRNLTAQPGCADDDGAATGMFAADQSLAHWLTGQIQADREYLQIQGKQIRNFRELVAEELGQAGGPRPATALASPEGAADPDTTRRVFVVYGRDGALTKSFFDLLYAVGLEPLEWERLIGPTGTSTPYLGQVVSKAPHLAQATLVLLSPDDIVELHPDLRLASDHHHERGRTGQARPNVLFELGLAFMAYPESTVIAEVGQMRPISDLAGLNVIRFDGSAISVKKVLDRLILAGCPVNMSGTSWLDPDRFAHLTAYHRGPDTAGVNGDRGT
jgi:predicted nucleotide-binding protein